jgi:DNA-binding GntR family transcriptional regulator
LQHVVEPIVEDMSLKLDAAPRLRTRVADAIRAAISANRFAPGSRLVEGELCTLLGVSRTTVREALRELESEGLITSQGGRLTVSIVGAKEAAEIYQVRVVLESLAARLFVRNASEAHMATLEACVNDLAAAYEKYEPSVFLTTKAALYEALFAGAGNDVAASMLRQIHTKVSQLRAASLSSPGRARASIAEIRGLFDALQARDEELAAVLTVRHIENASDAAMRSQFQTEPKPKRALR